MRRHRTKPICLLNEHGIHSLSNLLQIRMRLGLLCKILAVLGSSKTPARIWIDMVDKENRTSLASRSLVSCQFDSNHCEAHRFTVVHLPFFCFFMFLSYSWKWQQCWALPSYPGPTPRPIFPDASKSWTAWYLYASSRGWSIASISPQDPYFDGFPQLAKYTIKSKSTSSSSKYLPQSSHSHRISYIIIPLSAPTLLAVYLWKVLSAHVAKL